jgi:hypothetical protein
MSKFYFLRLLSILYAPAILAQESIPEKQRITDFCFSVGFPRNEFDRSSSLQPIGLTYNFLFKIPQTSPFIPGFGFSYFQTGRVKTTKNINPYIYNESVFLYTQPIQLKLRSVNQLLNVHLMARIQGEQSRVKPFVDLIAGVQYAWTQVTLNEDEASKYFQTDSKSRAYYDTHTSDLSWIAGGSFGVLWKLNSNLYLNSSLAFLFGGKLTYVDKTSAENWNVTLNNSDVQITKFIEKFNESDLTVTAPVKTSLSNMLVAQLGLTANISKN